ncbi:MAG: transposase [Candidatus Brocadiaceae bacterium]|nr:transposase [Candidatus Brocadiaceae bacterium]
MSRTRTTYTPKQIKRYLEKYTTQNSSAAQFCKENNLSISTFSKWRHRSKQNSSSFIKVEVPPKSSVLTSQMTIHYQGFSITNFETSSPEQLKIALSAISEVNSASSSCY